MMKTILCYGDSHVWGFIPGSFDANTGLSKRHPRNKRWTGVLQELLGNNYYVIEEGINGRTTDLDEITPGRPNRNGFALLSAAFDAHYPVDLVIFMLGSNDTKIQFNRAVNETKEAMRKLIHFTKTSALHQPKILLIAAPPIIKIATLHPQLTDESVEKSTMLGALYQTLAKEENCAYLDASQIVTASELDGVHFDEQQCTLLAQAVAEMVKKII